MPLSVFSKGKYNWTPIEPRTKKSCAARAKPSEGSRSTSISAVDDEERRRRMRASRGRNSIRLISKNATSILKDFDRAGQDRRRSHMAALKSSLVPTADNQNPQKPYWTTDRSGSAFGESGRRHALSRRSSATLFGIEEEANQDLDMSGTTPASRSRAKRMSMTKATLQDELNTILESEDRESRRRMRRSSSLVNALPDDLIELAVKSQLRMEEERRMSISKLILEEEELIRRRSSISFSSSAMNADVESDDAGAGHDAGPDTPVDRLGQVKKTRSKELMMARQRMSDPLPQGHGSGDDGKFIDKARRKMSILNQAINPSMMKAMISQAVSAQSDQAEPSEKQDHEDSKYFGEFRVSAASRCGVEMGRRKTHNQDSFFLKSVGAGTPSKGGSSPARRTPDKGRGDDDLLMFAVSVADGHGPDGQKVARAVSRNLVDASLESKRKLDPSVGGIDLMRLVFSRVDQSIKSLKNADISMSGSTAIVAIFHEADDPYGAAPLSPEYSSMSMASTLSEFGGDKQHHMTLAWVGDSRAVLGYYDSNTKGYASAVLTQDHKPESSEEKQRILSSEGRIDRFIDEATGDQIGPYRVFQKYAWIPGLAMSRAFGNTIAREVGVISEPDVLSHPLQPEDAFVILGTDGFWDFIQPSRAVEICSKSNSALSATNELMSFVKQQRELDGDDAIIDDTTAVVIFLPQRGHR